MFWSCVSLEHVRFALFVLKVAFEQSNYWKLSFLWQVQVVSICLLVQTCLLMHQGLKKTWNSSNLSNHLSLSLLYATWDLFWYNVRCLKAISIIIITSILCTTGWERFGDDIKLMLGSRPALWWRIMWQGVTPAIVAVSTSPTATAYVNHK